MTKNKQKLLSITKIGLAAAVLCVLSPISIPVGDVPLSAATLVILIFAGVMGPWKSVAAVTVYLVIGFMGLPVFSGFTAGVGRLFGPTGGYLLGYIPLAFTVGMGKGKIPYMIAGNIFLYAVGSVWYYVYADITPAAVLAVCVLPYLPGDVLKIAAASAVLHDIICLQGRKAMKFDWK